MQRNLIIFLIFCGSFNRVCGQSPAAAIDSLIKYQVISNKQRPVLDSDLIKMRGYSYRVAILGGLENITLQKIFHINPHGIGFISYRHENINKEKQDSINAALHILVDKINKAGLLTNKVYTRTLQEIDSGYFVADAQVIGLMGEMSSRLEILTPIRLLPVAEQLHKNGIVNDSSFIQLETDIKKGNIESAFQLNDYCKFNRAFDLAKYPDDPNVWVEQIHHDMATIMPGLNFTDFNYTVIPDTSFSIPGVRFKVSLTCNGHIYKYISLPLISYKNKQGKIVAKDIFTEDFHRIFNKILADQQSPYRLHDIMFGSGTTNNDDFHRFSLIALTGKQTEVFMKEPCLSYMLVTAESYDNALTSVKIDSTISEWKKIGLFEHLSDAEIDKATEQVKEGYLFSINNLLSNFPKVTYPIDSAIMSSKPPYSDLLVHLAGLTHGAFNPTKIIQLKNGNNVKLQYLSNEKIHSFTFNTKNGWVNAKFLAFLKHLSQENKLPGQFYELPYENVIIYLTEQQYVYTKEQALLDLGIYTFK